MYFSIRVVIHNGHNYIGGLYSVWNKPHYLIPHREEKWFNISFLV